MAPDNNDQPPPVFSGKFSVILIAMGSASFVVTMYHLIVICCQHSAEARRQRHLELVTTEAEATPSTTGENNSVAHLIPAHKYEKKSCDEYDDGTCAVCLGDFEEGEEVKTLPLCMHSFHVPCIDMWFHSHSTCPVCRADATPSPAPHQSPELVSGEVNAHHSIDMMQIALVQNGLVRR
ncbi:Zinc finger, RING-type [Sesbania bispinosa]|nr:Zinc finger, RING-type [Sesbania bispinosa]